MKNSLVVKQFFRKMAKFFPNFAANVSIFDIQRRLDFLKIGPIVFLLASFRTILYHHKWQMRDETNSLTLQESRLFLVTTDLAEQSYMLKIEEANPIALQKLCIKGQRGFL